MRNVAEQTSYVDVRRSLTGKLIDHMYGRDLRWVKNGRLIGEPIPKGSDVPPPDRGLRAQYGWRFT